jgi:3-dehydroquinate dehydratase-2
VTGSVAVTTAAVPPPVILLLSGPNLNLLGTREPAVYGTDTLDDHVARATRTAAGHGFALEHVQANAEGPLVDAVHTARGRCAAIVVNAGALTHYSWALHDALGAFEGVKVELHLSNTHRREPWRHHSVIAPQVHGSVQGFGAHGYVLAVEGAVRLVNGGPA